MTIQKHALVPLNVLALLILAFTFVGCGAASTGGSSAAGSSPTSTAPTSVKGYGTSNGCPSDMVVGNAPTKANVMLQPADANTTITAHTGDVIEVRLPFGHKWRGPVTSQGILQIQSPAGYAWKANNACVWRFAAKGTGNVQLDFSGQALCKPGQMCPMFIIVMPFKINVK